MIASPSFIGVDLAWGEGTNEKSANETGLVEIDETGNVLDAGWARGIEAVVDWLTTHAKPSTLIAIDAPLVVPNATGMRTCEREVGQRYGRWKVSANATNLGRGWQAGMALGVRLEQVGYQYWSGADDRDPAAVSFFECYPFTTLVGAWEFGYDVERPRYKRTVTSMTPSDRRAFRARECDELIRRFAGFRDVQPPLDLLSHPATRSLVDEPSPLTDVQYKHREDLLDAAIAAWTAALWDRFGSERCQVLGANSELDNDGRRATIIAPMRPEQASRASTRRTVRKSPMTPRSFNQAAFRHVVLSAVQRIELVEASGAARSIPVTGGELHLALSDDGTVLSLQVKP